MACVAWRVSRSIKNTAAFHDGQYAYDYPMVTQADIDQAAGPLLAALTPATQASLQGEVHPNERLAGQVGCHVETYDHEAVVRLVTNALMQQATMTLGTDYSLRGTISTTITPGGAAPHAKPGTLTLMVTGQGVWVYQVRRTEQARLTRLIVGLSRQQAIQALQQQEHEHLAGVHIQISGMWANSTTLPADPARIHLVVTMGG